jgi:hypothetical protein
MTLTESFLLALLLLELARFLLTVRQDRDIAFLNKAAAERQAVLAEQGRQFESDMGAIYQAELRELRELCRDHASLRELVDRMEGG